MKDTIHSSYFVRGLRECFHLSNNFGIALFLCNLYIFVLESENPSCQDRRVLVSNTFEAGKGCGLGAERWVHLPYCHFLAVTA